MKEKKTDRRSLRTQRLLGQALVALLLEKKRYDDITIQDILERADIGRSTFYEHFWDKEDLMCSQIEGVIDHLDQHIEHSEHTEIAGQHRTDLLPSLALFQHVYEQHRLYQALLRGQGIEIVTHAFQKHLRIRIETRIRAVKGKEIADDQLAAVSAYIAGAFMTLLQWWLETEMAWPPERIDTLFRDLVLPGIHHLLA